MVTKEILCPKNCLVHKYFEFFNFVSKKIFGSQRFWVSNNCLREEQILSPERFTVSKDFDLKKVLSERNFGPKTVGLRKIIWSKKNVAKNVGSVKNFGSQSVGTLQTAPPDILFLFSIYTQQAPIRHLPDTLFIHSRHHSNTFKTPFRHLQTPPDTLQAPSRHLSDTLQKPSRRM